MAGTTDLTNGSEPQVTFAPFLVTLTDLENGGDNDFYKLWTHNLLHNPDSNVVSDLTYLYEMYFPREAKVTPLHIDPLMIINWHLETGPTENVQVSLVCMVGL